MHVQDFRALAEQVHSVHFSISVGKLPSQETDALMSEIKATRDDQFDYLQHYDDVVGLDFGELCAAATVFRPREPGLCGSQFITKRGYLYGRTIPNSDWLEARKAANNIDDIDAALSESSPRSTYGRHQEYLRQLKANENGLRLWMFYTNQSVRRMVWDNAISRRSCFDKACYLVTNQARRTFDINREMYPTPRRVEHPRLVYAFGLDGMSRKSRRGALASMDRKITNAMYRKISRNNRTKNI
ncbi:hypothetical protein DFQ29_007100 [Apophysomyces sp. BC1021]|nr:hypothetical protein DFQ29_007100 [Apophysomyces sp. BC1021]